MQDGLLTVPRLHRWWWSLPFMQPVKRRVKELQRVYWKYFRPLYCEVIPTPAASRILVLAPHIDDDVIGCGGVLHQHARGGAQITAVYLRDGGVVREAEAHEAAKIIGIGELIFLRWGPDPDHTRWRGTVPTFKTPLEVLDSTVQQLCEHFERVKPDIVYAPFFLDPHPDHAVAARFLDAVAARGVPVGACYLYEVWSPLIPNALVDITPQVETKRAAIKAHRSQVATIDLGAGILGLNAYRAEMNRIRGCAEGFLRLGPKELTRMLREHDGS